MKFYYNFIVRLKDENSDGRSSGIGKIKPETDLSKI
jgi:hypothetical protein